MTGVQTCALPIFNYNTHTTRKKKPGGSRDRYGDLAVTEIVREGHGVGPPVVPPEKGGSPPGEGLEGGLFSVRDWEIFRARARRIIQRAANRDHCLALARSRAKEIPASWQVSSFLLLMREFRPGQVRRRYQRIWCWALLWKPLIQTLRTAIWSQCLWQDIQFS